MKNIKSIKKKNKTNKQIKDSKSLNIRASIDDEEDDDQRFANTNKKPDNKASKTPVLDAFSRDLTKMAMEGRIDPIIGRDKEIERVSQILSRRKKSNCIICGESGCLLPESSITIRKVSNTGNHKIIVVENA